jgi:hypothetical protein
MTSSHAEQAFSLRKSKLKHVFSLLPQASAQLLILERSASQQRNDFSASCLVVPNNQ